MRAARREGASGITSQAQGLEAHKEVLQDLQAQDLEAHKGHWPPRPSS